MKLAGSSEQDLSVDHLAHDAATFMVCTAPMVGNYQLQPYRALVDEAVDHLRENLFNRPESNRHMLGVATCCNSWGEARTLEKLGHPAAKIVTFDKRKKATRLTKDNLKAKVLGNSPNPWEEPWLVRFPKLLVRCTAQSNREYTFRVEADKPSQENLKTPREATESIGKRNEQDLAPLEVQEEHQKEGRLGFRRSENKFT